MTDNDRILQAGRSLFDDYNTRQPFSVMAQDFAPQTIDEAYDAQAEYLRLKSESIGPLGGYKIAYSTRAMQQRAGLTEPVYGGMYASELYLSPAQVNASDFVNVGIECEVAMRMGKDLPASDAPYSRGAVHDAVEVVMISFEIIDSRGVIEVDGPPSPRGPISMNISNAGAVLGAPISDWQSIDLAAALCTLEINGEKAGEGQGSDVMGHPMEPLVWLANALSQRGKGLKTGEVVITGSMIPPIMLSAGDTAVVNMDGLGEAELNVK